MDQAGLDKAILEHLRAVELAPDNGWFRYKLGMAYQRQRKFDEAVEQYKKTLEIDPGIAQASYRLGVLYSKYKKYAEAIRAYEQAIRLEPDNSDFHYGLGTVYAKIGKSEEAIRRYNKAIELYYFNSEAHFGLANAYLLQGNHKEGKKEMEIFRRQREGNIMDLEQNAALVPDNPASHYKLALLYAKQDRHIKAINQFKIAIGLDPYNPDYHLHLRDSYKKMGLQQEAERESEIFQNLTNKSVKKSVSETTSEAD